MTTFLSVRAVTTFIVQIEYVLVGERLSENPSFDWNKSCF